MRDTNDKSFFNQSFYFKLANLRSPNIQSITTTGIFQCPMIRNFNYYHWMALDAMSRLQLTTANGCGEPGVYEFNQVSFPAILKQYSQSFPT